METLDEKQCAKQLDKNSKEAEMLLHNPDKLDEFMNKLENKLSKIPMAGKVLKDIPILVLLIKAYVKKEYKEVPIGTIVAALAVLIYVVAPVDIIPDFIPGFGYIDDTAVIAFCLKQIHGDLMDFKQWQSEHSITA